MKSLNVLSRPYFAHPVNTYNTPLESAAMKFIERALPGAEVENPNQPHHRVGYARYAERAKESSTTHKGMNYFFDEVLPGCDSCIAMPFLDGRMGLGVAGEAKKFAEKNMFVGVVFPVERRVPGDLNKLLKKFIEDPSCGLFAILPLTEEKTVQLLAQDPKLVVPHEETRLRTWYIYNRKPRPYEVAHLVSMPIPPGFYPEKT